MKNSLIVLVAIIFVVTSLGWSQEVETADSIFKWFPQGTYMSMGHKNIQAMKAGKAFPLYEKYIGDTGGAIMIGGDKGKKKKGSKAKTSRKAANRVAFSIMKGGMYFGMDNKLPKQFKDGLVSSTNARFSVFETITDMEEFANSGAGKKQNMSIIMFAEAKKSDDGGEPTISQTTIMIDKGASMTVHRFADLSQNIEAAVKAGTLVKSGKRLLGSPVYAFANQSKGDRSSKLFAWASPENELLVCDSNKYLKEMIKAGNGDTMRLLDDEDYVDLVQLLPDLGSTWTLSSSGKTRKQFEKEMDKSSLTAEEIAERKDNNEKREILSIDSWKISDKIINASYRVFHTTEAAELALEKKGSAGRSGLLFAGDQPQMQEYNNMLKERTAKEVSGNVLMNAVSYDEKLFKAKERANEALAASIMNNKGNMKFQTKDGATMEIHLDISKEGKKKGVKITRIKKK